MTNYKTGTFLQTQEVILLYYSTNKTQEFHTTELRIDQQIEETHDLNVRFPC